MDAAQLQELVADVQADHEHGDSPAQRLCQACVDLIVIGGAGIMLMDDDGNGSSLGLSDHSMGVVEDLQFMLGEGPGIDAHVLGRPSLGPHLDDPVSTPWPAFASAAVSAGVLAAFGFPLRVGAVRLGSLDLYRDRPGALDLGQMEDAIAIAGIVTRAVLAMQGHADPGQLAEEMGDAGALRTQVHQASGMVSERLAITVGDALLRLRAHAYAEGRPINDVAGDVVERRVKLE